MFVYSHFECSLLLLPLSQRQCRHRRRRAMRREHSLHLRTEEVSDGGEGLKEGGREGGRRERKMMQGEKKGRRQVTLAFFHSFFFPAPSLPLPTPQRSLSWTRADGSSGAWAAGSNSNRAGHATEGERELAGGERASWNRERRRPPCEGDSGKVIS